MTGMVYEKFWENKSNCADAERRYYESLAKDCEKAPILLYETFWINKKIYENAERQYYENLAKSVKCENADLVVSKNNEQVQIVVESNSAPEKPKSNNVPEKTSKRHRRNKGSANVSESSNRTDSISEAVLSNNVKNMSAPAVDNQTKKSKDKSKNEKKQKTENDKASKSEGKPNEISETQSNLDKDGNAQLSGQCSLASEVEKARQHIKKSLECMDSVLASVPNVEVAKKIENLTNQVAQLNSAFMDMKSLVISLQNEVKELRNAQKVTTSPEVSKPASKATPAAKPAPAAKDDSDDGVDLFASESEDEEAAKIKEERLAAYAAKKSKKPALIAKSNIILDCKPWDDETDMSAMEKCVRAIEADGLLWGASKFVPLAYGIKKLQISCVVEDDKISVDWLQEEIEKNEDYVQSCDIAAFNKV